MTELSPAATALILHFEGCRPHPEWPGGASGITLGYGCDIGADPHSLAYWTPYLSDADIATLAPCRGVTGLAARDRLPAVRHIEIPQAAADAVFSLASAPAAIADTLRAFPGADALPPDSFGALVSLVYNRGTSMGIPGSYDRRAGMRAVRALVANGASAWPGIPPAIAGMSSLWPGVPTDDNLPGRRLAESQLCARGLGLVLCGYGYGDHGIGVQSVQRALGVTADGVFGLGTRAALLAWQHAHCVPATGYVDLWTIDHLNVPKTFFDPPLHPFS